MCHSSPQLGRAFTALLIPMKNVFDNSYTCSIDCTALSALFSAQLLGDLGASVQLFESKIATPVSSRWQESGLKLLTGTKEQSLSECPVPIAEIADGAFSAINLLSQNKLPASIQGADLLTIRASMNGYARNGRISAGGSCRMLQCKDGFLAVNLARDSDWDLMHAWLLSEVNHSWGSIEKRLAELDQAFLIEQARLLGLAVTSVQPECAKRRNWFELIESGIPSPKARIKNRQQPIIIDLSSLWAGPLCSRILRWAGAEVVKVESCLRPDGARSGSKQFFRFLNDGKQEQSLELPGKQGVATLLTLIRSADIVIESSRPRALRHMGIFAEELVREIPGLTWISISGYGRDEPEGNWIAYGDDAGVAGGLSAEIHKVTGQWMFCGDAIADPLTGLHAALAAYASWLSGGGHHLSLSLVETVRHSVLSRSMANVS